MSGFFIGAGALITVALLMLLYPLLRRDTLDSSNARSKINARVYKDQLAELDIDRSNGIIDSTAYEQSRNELERRALQDIGENEDKATRSTRWPAIVMVSVIPFAAIATYAMLGNPSTMFEAVDQHAMSTGKIQSMVANLAERLEKNPGDLKGWVMLGRAYKAMGRFPESIQAFERAGVALDEDPQYLIDFAEALARGDRDNFQKRGAPLIARALKIDPDHTPSLLFAGSSAFERGDYKTASRHWKKVLAGLPPDSEEARAVAEAISRADGGLAQGKSAKNSGLARVNQEPPANVSKTAAAAGSTPGVAGVVSLSPPLTSKVGPNDTVFVFARAAEGPRAPLAIIRAQVRDLPLKFVLDDSQAMSPELRISKFAKVRVEARISKSGNATPQSGDLLGASQVVAIGTRDLRVVIAKPVP